jgi:hypothetical protein
MRLNTVLKYAIPLLAIAVPIVALAAGKPNAGAEAVAGLGASAGAAGLNTSLSLAQVIGTIIKGALALVGLIFLILMVYAGYLWMIARGNEELVTKSKDTLRAAIIGIIIVVGAYAITSFIINSLTGQGGASTGASCPATCTKGCNADGSCKP